MTWGGVHRCLRKCVLKRVYHSEFFFYRNFSKISNVNITNWDRIHKEIIQKIRECDFVSIDIEYTGLHLKDERYISIDSSYEAHCQGARSFFPCQIGLTIAKKRPISKSFQEGERISYSFKKDKTCINRKRIESSSAGIVQQWDISPYSIYVFPKENVHFSVSRNTLVFLKENHFDFNEWIFQGVGYLRPDEEKEKTKCILEKINELHHLLNQCNNKPSPCEGKIDIDKVIEDIKQSKVIDEEDMQSMTEIIQQIGTWYNLDKPVKEKKEEKDGTAEEYPLYIEIENPYLRLLAHTLITKHFSFLFCITVKVQEKKQLAIYKTEQDSYKEQIKSFEEELEKIKKIIGVRLLFDEIINNKKMIIGHNCFYDMLHIYQTFYYDLPSNINEFKKKWTELFPYTFDTKYLNESNEHLYALNGPATLKGLCEYMASVISEEGDIDFSFNFRNHPLDLPRCFLSHQEKNENVETEIIEQQKDGLHNERNELVSKEYDTSKSDEHNAGYDSLLTCVLFIFQCYYILRKHKIMWKDVYFYQTQEMKINGTYFFDIFSTWSNKIKIVKTQPNVVSLNSSENSEMIRHFYMYDYPSYFKKWEIMKIWSPLWITLSKVNDNSCWIIAKSDADAKNIQTIYNMLKNPQFKLCTYEEYQQKFKSLSGEHMLSS